MSNGAGERQPLETARGDSFMGDTAGASYGMTVITLLKICIGTGVLAVPHAFATAGALPCLAMLLGLLGWNDWSARRLLQCRDVLSPREQASLTGGQESPLAALSRCAAGGRVAAAVEVCLGSLMRAPGSFPRRASGRGDSSARVGARMRDSSTRVGARMRDGELSIGSASPSRTW